MRTVWILAMLVMAFAEGLPQCVRAEPTAGPAGSRRYPEGTAQAKPAAAQASVQKAPAATKPSAAARQAPSKEEQALFDAANRERAARQLPPLKWSAALATAARAHAQKMAQAGSLSHQFPGEMELGMRVRVAGIRFRAVAENVAQGASAAVIHAEWMNSPAHRDNLLDRDLDSIGIAVAERNGEMFAVQDFTQANP